MVDELVLKSVWARVLVSRVLRKAIRKKYGIDIVFDISEVEIRRDESNQMKIHLNADAVVDVKDVKKIVDNM